MLPTVFDKMKFFHYSENQDFELEEVLPQNTINDCFKEALLKITYTENHAFDEDSNNPLSNRTREYYGRNKIKNEDMKVVEEEFKNVLDQKIDTILKQVKKETTISKRHSEFKRLLPEYHNFLKSLLPAFEFDESIFI